MSRAILLTAVFLTCGPFISAGFAETWVDLTGNFRIEAEFIGVEGKEVALKKPDGSVIRVPIAKLNAESVAQAKRLYLAAEAGGNMAPAGGADNAPATGNTGSSLGENPTIEQTLDVIKGLGTAPDPAMAWDMMPGSYRGDVNEIAQLLAQSVDAPTWDAAIGMLNKFRSLLDEKEEFILNSSLVPGDAEKQMLQQTLTVFEPMLREILASDLTNQSAMKTFDGDRFFETQYPQLKARAMAVAEMMKTLSPDAWKQNNVDVSFEVVSVESDSATVNMTSAEGVEEQTYRRIENRWMLAKTADQWKERMGKARQQLESLQTPEGQQKLAQARQVLSMGAFIFDPMLKASTQAEFDQAAAGLAAMASSMMPTFP